jgi:methionine-rich copper-binding protein CopC
MKTSIIAFCILILTAACKDTTPVVSYDNSPTDSSDKTAPTISSTSPSSGATTISISANITVTFSEEIDSSTINTSNITVQDSNGNVVKGVVSYSNRVATFNPISDLSYFTTYTVLVGIGVRDTSGNYIASLPNTSWSFTTEANNDTSAPTISYSSPSSGATNISATTDITITFSEDMDPSTINTTNISMFDNASNSVSGTVTYSSKVATFSPSSDLNWSTTYTVMVGVGVKDSSGNPMAGGGGWHFTTATSMSAVRPTISSVYPTSGADNISLSDNITITFSGAMDTSTIITSNTLNGTNITLQDSSGNSIQGAITYNNQVATFNPLSDLSYSETYTVTISTSVANSSGNTLAMPYSWSFQTVLNTPTKISAGSSHTCAVYFDKSIKCSGANYSGNLGNGTGILSLSPVNVTSISTAISVSALGDSSCALLSNKTIRCWEGLDNLVTGLRLISMFRQM